MARFSRDEIDDLLHAAVEARLDPEALRAGLDPWVVGRLGIRGSRTEQLLGDLHELNDLDVPAGRQSFVVWLGNADSLARPRREAEVFRRARERLERTTTTPEDGACLVQLASAIPASTPLDYPFPLTQADLDGPELADVELFMVTSPDATKILYAVTPSRALAELVRARSRRGTLGPFHDPSFVERVRRTGRRVPRPAAR